MIDLKKLIALTIDYMKQNNINELLSLKLPSSNQDSCWAWLTIKLFNEFNSVTSLNIYNMWIRNTKNYKSEVLNALIETNSNDKKIHESSKKDNFLNTLL